MQDFSLVDSMFTNIPLSTHPFLAIGITFLLFKRCPAAWFCDYGCQTALPKISRKRSIAAVIIVSMQIFLSLSPLYCDFLSYNIYPIIYVCAVVVLSMAALSDIFYQIIPDQYVLFLFILALANALLRLSADGEAFPNVAFDFLCGGLAGFLCYFIPLFLGAVIKKEAVVGFGDIKLMTALGCFLCPFTILKIYFFTCFFSSIYSIFCLFAVCLKILFFSDKTVKLAETLSFLTLPLVPFINFAFIFCVYF